MNDRATANGQAAVRDIDNSESSSGYVGVGILGDGASGNLIIQNLHVHVRLTPNDYAPASDSPDQKEGQ